MKPIVVISLHVAALVAMILLTVHFFKVGNYVGLLTLKMSIGLFVALLVTIPMEYPDKP